MNENTDRKTYTKPEVTTIDLVADEVLTTGCKTSGGGDASDVVDCITDGCNADFGS